MTHRIPRMYSFLWSLQLGIERLPLYKRAPRLSRWLYDGRKKLFPRDFLTGVYNSVAFEERVHVALTAGGAGALLVVDVDQFSWVNHALGHVKGDECLQHIASLLVNVGADAFVGRLSGEEFVVYANDGPGAEGLAEQIRLRFERDEKLEAIRAAVPRRTALGSSEPGCYGPLLTVTIGLSQSKQGIAYEDLLQTAYDAQTSGKAAGRNRVVLRAAVPYSRS